MEGGSNQRNDGRNYSSPSRRSSRVLSKTFLDRLKDGLVRVLIYTVTIFCMDERMTRTTVELPSSYLEIDDEMTDRLVGKKCINWCRTAIKLAALKNFSVGRSSLLQSLSNAMWGVTDIKTETFLRDLVNSNLSSARESARFKERWEADAESHRVSNYPCYKTLSWKDVCKAFQADDGIWEERTSDVESIHIFLLSNILRRSIVVVDLEAEDSDREIRNLSGLYLPLLIGSSSSFATEGVAKSPILLAHLFQRFYPIVVLKEDSVETSSLGGIPPMRDFPISNHRLEPISPRCLTSEECQHGGINLLQSYLNLEEIPFTGSNAINHVQAVRLLSCLPDDTWIDSGSTSSNHYEQSLQNGAGALEDKKCKTIGCEFSGSKEFNGMCYRCLLEATKADTKNVARNEIADKYTNEMFLVMSSGLVCSDPSCNESVDPEYYPKCKEHAKSFQRNDANIYGFGTSNFGLEEKHAEVNHPCSPKPGDKRNGKCSVGSCQREGSEKYQGRCSECYIREGEVRGSEVRGSDFSPSDFIAKAGQLKSSEGMERNSNSSLYPTALLEPSGVSWNSAGGGNLESYFERQISEQPKCPGCENLGLSTYNGLCSECFNVLSKNKVEKHIMSNERKLKGNVAPLDEDKLLQQQSSSKCITDGCSYAVEDFHTGLCHKCYDQQKSAAKAFEMQLQQQVQMKRIQMRDHQVVRSVPYVPTTISSSSKVPARHVTSHSAPPYHHQSKEAWNQPSYEEQQQQRQNGWRRCDQVQGQVQGQAQSTVQNSAQFSPFRYYGNAPLFVTSNDRSTEESKRAKLCRSITCDRFGDLNLNGYCSVCYVDGLQD